MTVVFFLGTIYFLECYKKYLHQNILSKKYLRYFTALFLFSILCGLSSWSLYYFLDKNYLLLCIICSSIVGFFFILCLCIRFSKKIKKLEEEIVVQAKRVI